MKKINYFAALAMTSAVLVGYLPVAHSSSKAEARAECKEQGLKGKAFKSCVQEKISEEKSEEVIEEQALPEEEIQPGEENKESSNFKNLTTFKVAQNEQPEEEELPPEEEETEPTPEV